MTKEQIKTQIEKLRVVGIEEKRLIRDNALFSDDAFDSITSPAHEVAYYLLKKLILVPDRLEEKIFTEFENYMYNIRYGNLEELLLCIERMKRE